MPDELEPPADEIRTRIAQNTRRALIFWAVRWTIGFGLAVVIVLSTGEHHWILAAAAAVAMVSLAVVLLNAAGQRKVLGRRITERDRDDTGTE